MSYFPEFIIFDFKLEIDEFLLSTKGISTCDKEDFLFIDEILASMSVALTDFQSSRMEINNVINFYTFNFTSYGDGNHGLKLVSESIRILANRIVDKLFQNKAYMSGIFPYSYNKLSDDFSVVFHYSPELFGRPGNAVPII